MNNKLKIEDEIDTLEKKIGHFRKRINEKSGDDLFELSGIYQELSELYEEFGDYEESAECLCRAGDIEALFG